MCREGRCTPYRVTGHIVLWTGIAGIIILAITLLSLTVNKKVAQDEYAVVINSYTKNFGTEILSQGAYTLNVGDEFILFKRTLQDVDNIGEIYCLTSDKIPVKLSVSIQYQLEVDKLIPVVLKQFGNADNFETMISKLCASIISNVCARYSAEKYYLQRGVIDGFMYHELSNEFANMSIGANIEYFQLINIDLPGEFTNIIISKQNVQQRMITAQNQRQSSLIEAQTVLLQTTRTANIKLINANNTAMININQALTSNDTIITQWHQRGLAYKAVKDSLNLNDTSFLAYLKSEIIRIASVPLVSF